MNEGTKQGLVALIQQAYPPGTRADVCAWGERSTHVALKGHGCWRWIIPCGPSSEHILAAWRPYGWRRVFWSGLLAVAHHSLLGHVPGSVGLRIRFQPGCWSDWGWVGTTEPEVAAYLGTPGENRKAVLFLIADHEPKLVAKVPMTLGGIDVIRHEDETLRLLRPAIGAPVPKAEQEGLAGTVQSWVGGRSDGTLFTEAHARFLLDLVHPGEATRLRDHSALLSSMSARGIHPATEQLLKRIHRVENSEVISVREHGDFAPWNIKWLGESRVVAVDWEASRSPGLPGWDFAFYILRVSELLRGRHPWDSLADLDKARGLPGPREYLARLGLSPELVDGLLAHAFLRYWGRKLLEPSHPGPSLGSYRVTRVNW